LNTARIIQQRKKSDMVDDATSRLLRAADMVYIELVVEALLVLSIWEKGRY
jgi:hypothetical protein